jgi:hypothetical protein
MNADLFTQQNNPMMAKRTRTTRCHSFDFTYEIDHPRESIKCNKDLRSLDGLTPKELMGSTRLDSTWF